MSESPRAEPGSDLTTRFAASVVMIAVATIAVYLGGWPDPDRPGVNLVDPLTAWIKHF